MTYGESTVGQTIDRLLSEHPGLDASADGALDGLDQFHLGGPGATGLVIDSLALTGDDRVLDVGSGFGGPARQLARRTGHHVTGIDITAAYVGAARDLTARAGLSGLVEFRVTDVAAFAPDPLFQAALTMHVQMNVQDKAAWFAHIARCLVPGGRLAVWEICQPRAGDLPWPMPWSLDGTDSFVAAPEALRTAIEQGGFTATEWANETARVQAWMASTLANGRPAGPALPMLLDDGYTRVINAAAAIGDGTLEVWRGAFTRTDG